MNWPSRQQKIQQQKHCLCRSTRHCWGLSKVLLRKWGVVGKSELNGVRRAVTAQWAWSSDWSRPMRVYAAQLLLSHYCGVTALQVVWNASTLSPTLHDTPTHGMLYRMSCIYRVSQKICPPFYFWIILSKIKQFLWFFGTWNPEQNWHQQLIKLPASPVSCSHFT